MSCSVCRFFNALFSGSKDKKIEKLEALRQELGLRWDEIACIGDDLNDLEMQQKSELSGCPLDALIEAKKKNCDYICQSVCGKGAVRELIEWLIDPCRFRKQMK